MSVEASETGDATMSGKSVSVSGTMSYTFSSVGDPIVVTAPI